MKQAFALHDDRGRKETGVNQQIVTLLIVLGMFILYLTERHPVALTTALGMMAMVVTGVLSFNEAFACFGNTAVMLTLGMLIIVNSVLDSGIAAKSERLLSRLAGRSAHHAQEYLPADGDGLANRRNGLPHGQHAAALGKQHVGA